MKCNNIYYIVALKTVQYIIQWWFCNNFESTTFDNKKNWLQLLLLSARANWSIYDCFFDLHQKFHLNFLCLFIFPIDTFYTTVKSFFHIYLYFIVTTRNVSYQIRFIIQLSWTYIIILLYIFFFLDIWY